MSLANLGSAWDNITTSTGRWMSGIGNSISESTFNAWVAAEARTAAHLAIPIYETAAGESINDLTSDMLRMYLNGTSADSNLIRKVGEEIAKSSTFGRLTGVLGSAVNLEAKSLGRMLTQMELSTVANRIVNRSYRDPNTGSAMYFDNSDRGLQGVIGGITGLSVSSVSTGPGDSYVVNVSISDTYDFNNQQPNNGNAHLQTYVRFRNRLSNHIQNRAYREFLWDYHSALYTGRFNGNDIARSRVFAAFMVAIERNGLTPGGVAWTVTIPFNGVAVY